MPPAVMLVIIVGLAVVVTIMVTGKVYDQESQFKAKHAELEAKMSQKGKSSTPSRIFLKVRRFLLKPWKSATSNKARFRKTPSPPQAWLPVA